MKHGENRKLAEFVLLRESRLETNIFEEIVSLKDVLLDKFNYLKNVNAVQLMTKAKAYQEIPYTSLPNQILVILDFKK